MPIFLLLIVWNPRIVLNMNNEYVSWGNPDVMGSILGVPHIFVIVWIFVSACLSKQPKNSRSQICMQAFMRVKWGCEVWVHTAKPGFELRLEYTSLNPRWPIRSFGFVWAVTGAWALLESLRLNKFKLLYYSVTFIIWQNNL